MRLTLISAALLAGCNVNAFAPASNFGRSIALQSTASAISPAEYNSKLEAQLEKMKSKDASSKSLSKAVSSYFMSRKNLK